MNDDASQKTLSARDVAQFVYREGTFELRIPLTGIRTMLQFLQRFEQLPKEARDEMLATALRQIDYAQSVADKVHTYCHRIISSDYDEGATDER